MILLNGLKMQIFKIVLVGFLFGFFGLLCAVGNLFFWPVILTGLYKRDKIKLICRKIVQKSWWLFIKFTEFLGYQKSNAKSILSDLNSPGALIISNHPSLMDVVFYLSYINGANCVVKGALAKNIWLHGAIKASGYIVNNDNEATLKAACEALKNGESLIIFPEGSRTKEKIVLHKAAAYIAINGAKCVYSVFCDMQPRSLAKNQPWYQTPDKRINYDFSVMNITEISSFEASRPAPVRARMLNAFLQNLYSQKEAK